MTGNLGELKRLFDVSQSPGDCQMFAALEYHNFVAHEIWQQLLHMPEVYNGASADAHEFFRLELFGQRSQSLTYNQRVFARLHDDVIPGGLNGFNFPDTENDNSVSFPDG